MIRIIIADNQPIYQAGVAKTLVMSDDIQIVAQCNDGDHLMRAMKMFRRSIAIFSSSMEPEISALLHIARTTFSRLIVIVENQESLSDYADHLFHGVLSRNVDPIDLMECVQRVAIGEASIQQPPHALVGGLADAVGSNIAKRLTAKELQIIRLVVQGYKNKQISTQIGTTEQVIKNYLSKIYDKVQVSDRLELALLVTSHRMLFEAVVGTPNFRVTA